MFLPKTWCWMIPLPHDQVTEKDSLLDFMHLSSPFLNSFLHEFGKMQPINQCLCHSFSSQKTYSVLNWPIQNLQPFSRVVFLLLLSYSQLVTSSQRAHLHHPRPLQPRSMHPTHPTLQKLYAQLVIFDIIGHFKENLPMNISLIFPEFSFLYLGVPPSHKDTQQQIRKSGFKDWLKFLVP